VAGRGWEAVEDSAGDVVEGVVLVEDLLARHAEQIVRAVPAADVGAGELRRLRAAGVAAEGLGETSR